MLAVFAKAIGKPPEELRLPAMGSNNSRPQKKLYRNFNLCGRILRFTTFHMGILWHCPMKMKVQYTPVLNFEFSSCVSTKTTLENRGIQLKLGYYVNLSIVVLDDIFCIFMGSLANIAELRHHYGLARQATEAMIVIEAYKALRDRAPYPPDQVVKHLDGKFAFIIFDAKTYTLFKARDREGSVKFQWGMARDGSLVCSDDPTIIREGCGNII
ncbi:Stem-specific protein TSJT1 [Glycine soja]|uniref:Stem-specific protein TSJT1 n=1 Tax=Glycine soja TaxID=3848 RepID=A0A445I969_GLYSO|nr:Stem-specific protein TSJT1 [Glycine soja]